MGATKKKVKSIEKKTHTYTQQGKQVCLSWCAFIKLGWSIPL